MIVCAQCHAAIVARYAATPMARTSGLIDASAEPAGEFFHAASRTRFEIVKSRNRLELEWNRHRQALDFFIGSRRMGRSYGFIENGYYYQAPVGYYANRHLWDVAPGYENDRTPDLNRPITPECLFCHASGAAPVSGTVNRYADTSGLRGVSCERCHGDASAHLAHPQKGNIVNPQKLPAAERDSVCEQCHLAGEARFPKAGRRLGDFLPGQRLSMYLAVFVAGGERSGIRVNSHAEALSRSRCRLASGPKLWCGTCHDPHGPPVDYRAKCLGCHAPDACPKVHQQSLGTESHCIGCHMPKARAYDGGHSVFTDHSIPRRPAHYDGVRKAPAALQEYYSGQADTRDWGIAWMEIAEGYSSAGALQKAWPLLRTAVGPQPDDPLLFAKIAEALESAKKLAEAERIYAISLQQDPEQVDVLLRLADLYDRSGEQTKAASLRKRAAAIVPRLDVRK